MIPEAPCGGADHEPVHRPPDVLQEIRGAVLGRARRGHQREPRLGGRLPAALAARQDRALDPWHQLHRLVQLEDLRQERAGHLGDPADRLSAHPARDAEPRAARLLARGQLLLVSLQRQPPEIPAGPRPAAQALARGPQDAGAGRSLGLDRRGSGQGQGLQVDPRHGRLRALDLARGQRDHRRRQRLHGQDLRPRPRGRLLADPGHVDGLLCRRHALSVADRRHLHELLRLVLRSAAVLAADLRRADRRARERGLVQRAVPDPVGLERAADADARCPLLHRGPLQGRQERRGLARLQRGRQVLGSLAAPAGRHRRRARDGARPRHPQGVPRRAAGAVLRGLLPALHRHAIPGPAGAARRCLRARPVRARRRLRGRAGPGEQSRLEDGRLRRAEPAVRRAARARSAFAGASRASGTSSTRTPPTAPRSGCSCPNDRAPGRGAAGAVPLLRRPRARIFQEH